MPVQARIDNQVVLSDGRLELTVSVIVNGTVVGSESMVFHDPASLTVSEIRDKVIDRVRGLKEKYKASHQARTLVGQTIDVEP
jgi:hypothetical protein